MSAVRRYRSSLTPAARRLVGMADTVLPGHRPAARQLSRRSAWPLLPHLPAARPDAVKRLALTVDLDYQADTDALPELVELVARFEVAISVAAVGALVEADPGPYAQALAAGHEIVNHSQTHPDNPVLNPDEEFWHLSEQRMTEEIGRAQDAIESRLGVRPAGFRTPHFKDAHRLTSALGRFPELRYNSSVLATRSPLGAEPYPMTASPTLDEDGYLFAATDVDDESLLQIPLTACPAHRWSPFCSWHGIRAGGDPATGAGMHGLDEWSRLWSTMLQRSEPDGLVVVYFDPQDLCRDPLTRQTFADMIESALASGWQTCTLSEVADGYRSPLRSRVAAR